MTRTLVSTDVNFKTDLEVWGKLEHQIKNNQLVITCDNEWSMLTTKKSYPLPLKVELCVKSTGDICVHYRRGKMTLNWSRNESELRLADPLTQRSNEYKSCGAVEKNKFIQVTWIIDNDYMAVLVDGETRCLDNAFAYTNHKKPISDRIRIATEYGNTITVKSVTITSCGSK